MPLDPTTLIPHRPPFLLLDAIDEVTDTALTATTCILPDDPLFAQVFQGHYPGNPVTPGVLLCEMIFQAGAALMAHRLRGGDIEGTPVMVKITNARFRRIIRPGDTVSIEAVFVESVSNAFYLKGSIRKNNKIAVRVDFTCALAKESDEQQTR